MRISLVKTVMMAGIAALVQGAMAGTITVSPGEDLASAIGSAADGDVVSLASGRYELASTIGLANRKNLTILGGGGYILNRHHAGGRRAGAALQGHEL